MNRILVVSASLTLTVTFDLIRPAMADEQPTLHNGSAAALFSNDGVPVNLLSAGAPLSVVAPPDAGRIQYANRAWPLTKPASCHLTADLVSFEYRIDSQPVLAITIEYRRPLRRV